MGERQHCTLTPLSQLHHACVCCLWCGGSRVGLLHLQVEHVAAELAVLPAAPCGLRGRPTRLAAGCIARNHYCVVIVQIVLGDELGSVQVYQVVPQRDFLVDLLHGVVIVLDT